jgi:hypothetical protein
MTAIDRNVQYKNIDLAKTFTGEFVSAARLDPRPAAAAAGR